MPKLTIDGKEITVEPGTTVLQACEQLGIEIPRFCYHERLSIAGNCRMCLVEQEKAPKPIASCAMPVMDNMVIHTDTPLVKKACEGVMEFLLINHPLDCPICDQGGECDLQDQAMGYGRGSSRFHENKRAVKDKYIGPLVKTIMTRCIHCTRCIRFSTEVAGVEELGAVGRGEDMQITTYLEKAMTSEMQGNVIDLCPVGALTSKPYAFSARPWELRKTESVDVMDALGSNVRIDARGTEVMRVLPRTNDDVNEEWISDKTRFACDGLKRQRLDTPYVRRDGKLKPASWAEAFDAIAARLNGVAGAKIAAIAGDLCDAESMLLLKELMASLGSANIDCRQDGARLDPKNRAGWLFNSTIAGIEQADALLLVGCNPRKEAAVLNARIRKRYLAGGFKAASIGPKADLTFACEDLGNDPKLIEQIAAGAHPFAEILKAAKRPMVIVGMAALARADGAALLPAVQKLAEACNLIQEGWNGFNVLHNAAARVGGLEIGFVPGEGGRDVAGILDGAAKGQIEVVYLLGADEIDTNRLGKAFVIYQGHHGDRGAHRADVILPGAAYTEKDGTYVNLEGRAQRGRRAVLPPGDAREDWTILRALSERLGKTLPYNTIGAVREKLAAVAPCFARVDRLVSASWAVSAGGGAIEAAPFQPAVADFYLTNPVARASRTMAECSALAAGRMPEKGTGTHG
ncbi:NADH-quinone oxidoreductase subunit NuoG [Desertibaculum subflavum]|uniref:NADH-quinone oxidoreductase subunit NuoG n=1 Tax=Desertibaculum subflavum TaxID=2268458 RepID=UPI000E675C1C